MKKIIFISTLAVFTLAGCKKDRTCTCTSTVTSYTVNGQTQTITDPPTKTVTKLTKVAKDGVDCNSGEETLTINTVIFGQAVNVIQKTKNDCTLE